MAESIYNDLESPDKLKMRLNLTPQNGAFTPMSGIGLSGGATYTFNSQTNGENSPKRFKTLGTFDEVLEVKFCLDLLIKYDQCKLLANCIR